MSSYYLVAHFLIPEVRPVLWQFCVLLILSSVLGLFLTVPLSFSAALARNSHVISLIPATQDGNHSGGRLCPPQRGS